MRRRPRHRIEQRKQHQAGEKSADMRLPGDAGAVGADRNRSDAEDDVDAEPDRQKPQHARLRKARASDSAGTFAAASASPRLNERKLPCTKAKRMAAAIVPDTDAEAPIIGAIACSWVTRCASAPAAAVTAMNSEKPDRAEAARQRAAERQQPQHVEADMAEIGVQQRIGDEGPDLGAGAAGKGDVEQRRIVALRNEAEDVDGPVLEYPAAAAPADE